MCGQVLPAIYIQGGKNRKKKIMELQSLIFIGVLGCTGAKTGTKYSKYHSEPLSNIFTDSCDVDCLTTQAGVFYTGTLSKTRSGYTCQRWDTQTPHSHSKGTGWRHNYCRNPSGGDTVWCYTMDKGKRWEYCDVRECTDCDTATGIINAS